jgi:alpha-beta hydrolase superfamily lysophospholipase
MNLWKLSVVAAVLGLILGFGFFAPSEDRTGPVSEDASWDIGDTTVYATLTGPRAAGGLHPAVLLIAGSGPTTRDWTSPILEGDNGSARLLADVLADQGYVTLRYDKRVAGQNASENVQKLIGKISMQSHLDEVASAVKFLASQPNVDPTKIYVLTNSEGAIHALNYIRSDPAIPFAGMILTGAPGRSIGQLTETQVQFMLRGSENADELYASYTGAVDAFLAGQEMTIDPELPEPAQLLLQSLATPVNQPFVTELWMLDIAPWLAEVTVPTLILIGKKDIQVDWQLDGQPLEAQAAGNPMVAFAYPEDANHVLKYEAKPREALTVEDSATYNLPDRVLDPGAVAVILDWLANRQ